MSLLQYLRFCCYALALIWSVPGVKCGRHNRHQQTSNAKPGKIVAFESHVFTTNSSWVTNVKHVDVDRVGLAHGGADFRNPPNPAQYFSQQGQDEMVAFLSSHKPSTNASFIYVDLASNNWFDLSNTLYLDLYYNTSGSICIEPLPAYHNGLLANRKCKLVTNPVYSESNKVVTFHVNHVFSGIVGNSMDNKVANRVKDFLINTVTLKEVLDHFKAPHTMDYLSLDVEGGEFEAISTLKSSEYIFLHVTVERPNENCHKHLIAQGYSLTTTFPIRHLPITGTRRFDVNWREEDKIITKTNETSGWHYGECLYIHSSHPNFSSIMEKYRPLLNVRWFKADHNYLLTPEWNAKKNS